jgi:hypothetical protein
VLRELQVDIHGVADRDIGKPPFLAGASHFLGHQGDLHPSGLEDAKKCMPFKSSYQPSAIRPTEPLVPRCASGEAVRAPAAEIGVGVAPDRGVALEVRPFTEDRGQFFVRRLARWLVERKLKSSFSRRSRNRGPSPRRPQVSGGHNENFPNSSKWAFYNDASRAGPPSTPEPIYSGKRGCNCIGLGSGHTTVSVSEIPTHVKTSVSEIPDGK